MKWPVAITGSLVLNLALIFLGRGDFTAQVLPLITSFWIGLPLLAVSGIFFAIGSRRRNRRLVAIGAWTLAMALIVFSTMASIPFGKRLLASDLRQAKSFCEQLVPELEQAKERQGYYPDKITDVLAGQKLPRCVPPGFYGTDGTNFSFMLNDPGTIMGGPFYNSEGKVWARWD